MVPKLRVDLKLVSSVGFVPKVHLFPAGFRALKAHCGISARAASPTRDCHQFREKYENLISLVSSYAAPGGTAEDVSDRSRRR